MSEWLVCQNKSGEYFTQRREEREYVLRILSYFGHTPSSFVVKRFYDLDDAAKYVEEMTFVNKLIEKIK